MASITAERTSGGSESHFDIRMPFDGAHQRLDLAGFRHQKQQRKCIVSLVSTLAGKVSDRFISKAGRSDRRSDLATSFGRSFSQGAREGRGAIFLKIKQGSCCG